MNFEITEQLRMNCFVEITQFNIFSKNGIKFI